MDKKELTAAGRRSWTKESVIGATATQDGEGGCIVREDDGPFFLFLPHQAVGCTVQVLGGSGPSAVASQETKAVTGAMRGGFASGKGGGVVDQVGRNGRAKLAGAGLD